MTKLDILKALNDGTIYDYVAAHYWEMSNSELERITLAAIGSLCDKTSYKEAGKLIKKELDWEGFFEE